MNNGSHILDAEQDRIDEQASEWVVLLDERELTAAEQGDFDLWLAADPRHRTAWRELSNTWATIPVLNNISHLVSADPVPAAPAPAESLWRRARGPKLALGAFAAIAATFLVFVMAPSLRSEANVYQTDLAQTQLLTLEDGSQVTLGPRSRLTVKFDGGERRVALAGGEAFFEVAHDKNRPFYVEAGRSVTRVVGTKFDVNYATGSVRVAVLEGVVQVSRLATGSGKRPAVAYLRAGQGAEVRMAASGDADAGAEAAIISLPAQAPGAWREGRLVYENARLSDLVADVNRYYAPGVTIADKSILDMRVTASFKASEIPAFMGAVGSVLPMKAVAGSDGSYRLEPAGR